MSSVLWSNHYRTPRSVWTASAIAAALLHGGLAWWAMSAWQSQRTAPPPSPIRVIALPPESETVFEPSPAASPSTVATSPFDPATTAPQTESFEPVPPNTGAPPAPALPPSEAPPEPQSVSPPVEPVAPAPSPNPVPATPPVAPIPPAPTPPVPPSDAVAPPSEPVAPVSAPEPIRPVPNPNPVAPTPAPAPSPVTAPPVNEERPFPATTGELSPRDSGVQAFWTLQEVPGGSDLPEELPRLPSGWRESTSALLANADCAAGLVPPGTSVRVTLWPVVEADGRISDFYSWDGGGNEGKAAVVDCVESLGSRMAPIIPASVGGETLPSYAMLLVVELQGIE